MMRRSQKPRSFIRGTVYLDRPMSAGEVAAALDTTLSEVYRCASTGVLRATKGAHRLFFDPKDVLAFDGKAPDRQS